MQEKSMKKIYSILLILAAAAGVTNCSKADLVENKETGIGGTIVYATTDATTKTTLADDYKVLWSTGDKIKFVKNGEFTTTYTYTLLSGEETTNGTFRCAETPVDGTYTVYYPASYDGTNWPAQTYAGEKGISGAPMKATNVTVSGGVVPNISFNNVGGILRYTVKGSKTIRTINVKSGLTLNVTLSCGTSGIALATEGTVFNVAVPEGTYSSATLKITATDNTVATKSATSFTVTKNKVSLATFEETDLSFVNPNVPDGFVDLGVTNCFGNPLYWKKCNLGATNPQDPGDYYMWGATALMYSAVDYTKTEGAFTFVTENPYGSNYKNTWDASKGFAWNNAPFTDGVYNNSDKKKVFTKYTTSDVYAKSNTPDNLTTLKPEDDAATAENPNWRMPTKDEFLDLRANCVWIWTTNYNGTGTGYIVYKAKNGDSGMAYYSNKWHKWNSTQSKYEDYTGQEPTYESSDNHIFLPAAGIGSEAKLNNYNKGGSYWSSSLATPDNLAFALSFMSSGFNISAGQRQNGHSIRPVTE